MRSAPSWTPSKLLPEKSWAPSGSQMTSERGGRGGNCVVEAREVGLMPSPIAARVPSVILL